MPIRELDNTSALTRADKAQKILVKEDDQYVISGWEQGVTMFGELKGNPVEIIGTLKTPLTTAELLSCNVNIKESIAAGLLGKIVDGQAVYFINDNAYDEDYSGLPDHLLGNTFHDGKLKTDARETIAEPITQIIIDEDAFLAEFEDEPGTKPNVSSVVLEKEEEFVI